VLALNFLAFPDSDVVGIWCVVRSKLIKKVIRSESKAVRSYWSIHVDAWLRCGVSRQQYCREHRLSRRTMMRWIRLLELPLPKRRKVRRKPTAAKRARIPANFSRASKSFWMMHVEALRGSGLTANGYALVHHLPERRLRKERLRFERSPPAQNWRELMHPSNREPLRSGANLRYELRHDLGITLAETTAAEAARPPSEAASRTRRRQFTDQQKLAIVTEAADPGVTVASVAERHRVTAPMIFRWRGQLGMNPKEQPLLVTARVIDTPSRGRPKTKAPIVVQNLLPQPPGTIAVELTDGRIVFAPEGADPESVRQYVAQRESAR
jgi:transposase-like protein